MAREMSVSEQKAWMHFLEGDPMFRDFVARQTRAGDEAHQRIASQPMCPKCERPGFHDVYGMACNNCGYRGIPAMTTRQYLKEGWWK